MKLHELLDNDSLRTNEGLASWLVKTGAKMGGKAAVKAGLKGSAPAAEKVATKVAKSGVVDKGFKAIFKVGEIVKWLVSIGFGYSVAKPVYDYYTNVSKAEDNYKAGATSQEEYQYIRQQLMGLMLTKIAVLLEGAAFLGSIGLVAKILGIFKFIPGVGLILRTVLAMDTAAAAAFLVALNSEFGRKWITKIAFFHLSEIFPSLKGSQWDLDIADVLGAGGVWITDEFKKLIGKEDPADAPIQGNTPAQQAGRTPDDKATDTAQKQHADQQTKDTDEWEQIAPGREQNKRTGVIRMNDKY
jgi:hypothetical protein